MSILKLKNVSYRYKDAKKGEYVLKNIDYEFCTGKLYVIKGKSGSGKTTFLSLVRKLIWINIVIPILELYSKVIIFYHL